MYNLKASISIDFVNLRKEHSMLHDIKKDLINIIKETDDENLLQLMKEDFDFYSKTMNTTDIVDHLNSEQLMELNSLSAEPDLDNVHSLDEYQKATSQWRMK